MVVNKRLLIVEDDPGLQSQMRWCFSDDLEVAIASDRESALTALRRLEPEVVTLDLGLPPDPGYCERHSRFCRKFLDADRANGNSRVATLPNCESNRHDDSGSRHAHSGETT